MSGHREQLAWLAARTRAMRANSRYYSAVMQEWSVKPRQEFRDATTWVTAEGAREIVTDDYPSAQVERLCAEMQQRFKA